MTKKRSTKSALLSSVLALFLCCTMLLGTTFAWFTDEVTSANNIIKSGNLDIVLEYWNGKEWKDVKDSSDILTGDRWEPGYVDVAYLRFKNNGSLALKYRLGVNIVSETPGVNVDQKEFKLSDYIYFDVEEGVDGEKSAYATREAAMAIATETKKISAGYAKVGSLAPESDFVHVAMVVYMPVSVGNEANHNGTNVPQIELGINIMATQDTVESDSFDEYYDGGATWLGGVNTDWYFENPDATEYQIRSAEELAGLAALINGVAPAPVTTYAAQGGAQTVHDDFAGKTITLSSDVDLNEIPWIPAGRIGTSSTDFTYAFKGTFDGQDHTIYNLKVEEYGWAGVFGLAYKTEIKNLKVEGVSIQANRMAGAIVGQLYGSLDKCQVKDAEIIVVPNQVGDTYDNGDKVGGIVGWLGDNGNNRTLTNCSAIDVELSAYRDVGGIAGYVASSTTVSDNKVENIKITVDQISHYYGSKDPNAGAIVGRTGGTITEKGNTQTGDIVIDSTVSENGITYKIDGVTNEKILYLVPMDYAEAKVVVPEGVTALGNNSFSYNSNVKEVVLSSTVRSLGRAFDSSTVETVVLNEGLETIDSRAFKATTALKEVVISSTVKTIADNAFQKSGIKNITIPATVETVGETAFGASLIESVTFEGNTSIQGYAFRGCPNLRTVYLLGDDVTFIASTLNGRNSMWFCNSESNNPNTSDIDFYVVNETVKERVLTAMGAEKDNTDVYVVDVDVVSTDAELSTAITNAIATNEDAVIYLADGTYSNDIALTVATLGQPQCNNLIFKAAGNNAVIAGTVTIGYRQQNVGAASYETKITFDGITFDHAEAGKHCLNVQDVESFHMVNCTVIGDGEYGLSTPGSNGTGAAKIENCKFVNAGLQISGKFAQTLVIDNCKFEESVVNVQGGGPLGPTIQNSKFDITLKAAHNNGSFYVVRNSNAGANINVKNCDINVDAETGFTGVAGKNGWGVFVGKATNAYTLTATDVRITMTSAALEQNALQVSTIASGSSTIVLNNVTLNGSVVQ